MKMTFGPEGKEKKEERHRPPYRSKRRQANLTTFSLFNEQELFFFISGVLNPLMGNQRIQGRQSS